MSWDDPNSDPLEDVQDVMERMVEYSHVGKPAVFQIPLWRAQEFDQGLPTWRSDLNIIAKSIGFSSIDIQVME